MLDMLDVSIVMIMMMMMEYGPCDWLPGGFQPPSRVLVKFHLVDIIAALCIRITGVVLSSLATQSYIRPNDFKCYVEYVAR